MSDMSSTNFVGRHVTRDEFFYVLQDNYDEHAELAIPGYREMHDALVDLLLREWGEGRPLKLLDLGTGTGKTAAGVLRRFKSGKAVCIDVFEEMMAHAQQRFEELGLLDRVELREADFMDCELGKGFDACVSALAIHHQDEAGKRALFGRIADSLAPGGYFCMIDWVKFPDEQKNQASLSAAEAHVRRHVPGAIADAWVHHWKYLNRPSTEEELCEWLVEAGFQFAFCAVRHFGMALIYGVK